MAEPLCHCSGRCDARYLAPIAAVLYTDAEDFEMSASDNKLPNLAALLCVIVGLLIGAVGGLGSGSFTGGVIAGIGSIPACWGIWSGMQQKTQTSLVWSILLLLASLGISALLVLLAVVNAVAS